MNIAVHRRYIPLHFPLCVKDVEGERSEDQDCVNIDRTNFASCWALLGVICLKIKGNLYVHVTLMMKADIIVLIAITAQHYSDRLNNVKLLDLPLYEGIFPSLRSVGVLPNWVLTAHISGLSERSVFFVVSPWAGTRVKITKAYYKCKLTHWIF